MFSPPPPEDEGQTQYPDHWLTGWWWSCRRPCLELMCTLSDPCTGLVALNYWNNSKDFAFIWFLYATASPVTYDCMSLTRWWWKLIVKCNNLTNRQDLTDQQDHTDLSDLKDRIHIFWWINQINYCPLSLRSKSDVMVMVQYLCRI